MSVKSLTQLALGLLAATAFVPVVLPQSALAQFTDAQPLQDWQGPESRDPFSGKSDGGEGAFSVFDMIHRANLGNTRSLGEFTEEQNESLDAAAEAFRNEQRVRLQSPTQVNPGAGQNPVTTPQSGN